MEQYDLWKLDKKLQKEVDEDRYHHTLGVMFTASSMAMVGRGSRKSPCRGTASRLCKMHSE